MNKLKYIIGILGVGLLLSGLGWWSVHCPQCVLCQHKFVKLYTVYHKNYIIRQNDIVIPIHAGRALHTELGKDIEDKMIGDDTGKNISKKNKNFAELTVMYWMWKNEHNTDYIGLMHYRRYFMLVKGPRIQDILVRYGLDEEHFRELAKKYDIILPYKSYKSQTIYQHYVDNHYKEDIEMAVDYIRKKYPEMNDAVDKYLVNAYSGYYTNIFIMRKDIFDKYAEWLFDIMFTLEDKLDPKLQPQKTPGKHARVSNYQDRVEGFLAERLFNVWIGYNRENYRIGEFDVDVMP